jgi:hypothetical protein
MDLYQDLKTKCEAVEVEVSIVYKQVLMPW